MTPLAIEPSRDRLAKNAPMKPFGPLSRIVRV